MQINNYYNVYNREPNNIIIGKDLFDTLKQGNYPIVQGTPAKIDRHTISGISITVDYDDKKTLKVGYME